MQVNDNSIIPESPDNAATINKTDEEIQPAVPIEENIDNDNIDPTTVWNVDQVEIDLKAAYETGLEIDLLKILKANSFLFYELYKRKWRIHPVFAEVSFGGKYKADFVWLNDDSDGPEWVLVEVEKPRMNLFKGNDYAAAPLNNAIDQMKSWDRYFKSNPLEAKRIFGAVAKFRYILVAGDREDWQTEQAMLWRNQHNIDSKIEIRSLGAFLTSLEIMKKEPKEFWSFAAHPIARPSTELEPYWKGNKWMDEMRLIFA
jgi:hypothetical protein